MRKSSLVQWADEPGLQKFLFDIRQGDAATRLAAVQQAAPMGNAAVQPLGQLLGGEDQAAAKAAREALRRIAHYAARPGANGERKSVAGELVKLVTKDRSRETRIEALHLLEFVGGKNEVSAIANQLTDRDVFQAARMALERIPDRAAEKALQKAMRSASEESRSAMQYSVQHKHTRFDKVGTAS